MSSILHKIFRSYCEELMFLRIFEENIFRFYCGEMSKNFKFEKCHFCREISDLEQGATTSPNTLKQHIL